MKNLTNKPQPLLRPTLLLSYKPLLLGIVTALASPFALADEAAPAKIDLPSWPLLATR